MHPILAYRGGLLIYLAAWLPGSGLLAILLAQSRDVSWEHALALSLPLALVFAFICLASWYPCLAAPASPEGAPRLFVTHAVAAVVSSGLWLVLGLVWAKFLERFGLTGIEDQFRDAALLVLVIGILLYLLTVAVHYLLIAFQASRDAELEAVEARREQELAAKELELARSIQRRLLPPAEMEGEGFRLAARHRAAQFVAGDFYDIFRIGDGQLGLVVADVAGKGFGASLIMASVKAMLPLVAADNGVVETLRQLNRKLVDELARREFVALLFARFDPSSGRLEFANSGLPDPYLLRGSDRPTPVEVPGPRLPLGIKHDLLYESLEIELAPQDRLLLLTDGLPEACTREGEPLGYRAFEALMVPPNGKPGLWLDALLERVHEATTAHHDDDLTALVLERTA